MVATSPVISRLYTPEEFGLFSIFFSIFGIVSILSTLQFQNAIPLPSHDRDGARLLIASLAVLLIFTVAVCGVIGIFGDGITQLANFEADHRIIWLLPAAIAAANANLCLHFWFLRKKEYTNLAVVKGVQSVAMAGGQIALGLAHFGVIGLIAGHLLGQASGILQLTTGILSRYKSAFSEMQISSIFEILWQNRSFVTTYTPSALLSAATIYLPAIMLGFLYGPAVAGVFAFALQISKAGINIIVQAVSRVYLVNSIEDYNNGDHQKIKHRAIRFALSQFLLGAPVFLLLAVFGEAIFDVIFGRQWALGGVYVVLLIPHLMAIFVFDHLAALFVVTGSHKAKLIWDILKFLVLFLTFVTARAIRLDSNCLALGVPCSTPICRI